MDTITIQPEPIWRDTPRLAELPLAAGASLYVRDGGVRARRVRDAPALLLSPGEGQPTRIEPGGSIVICHTGDDPVGPGVVVATPRCRLTHAGATVHVEMLGSGAVEVGGVRVERGSLPAPCAFRFAGTLLRVVPEGRQASLAGLVGSSDPMRRLALDVRMLAAHTMPVLVRGETGTGKELVARALHACSSRRGGPFVAINAATVSLTLSGSELFGHRRGAFTGAHDDRRGAFVSADGGTLFLDELGSLPPAVQARLLRVVEDGTVVPLGADKPVMVDVRIISATCEPLEQMVVKGGFRQDLYERLATCVVQTPPLRDRASDIPALCDHLLGAASLPRVRPTPDALALLKEQPWPGNVRELRSVILQASLGAQGEAITADAVARVLRERGKGVRKVATDLDATALLAEAGGNISEAARRARVPRSTFRDLLRRACGGAGSEAAGETETLHLGRDDG